MPARPGPGPKAATSRNSASIAGRRTITAIRAETWEQINRTLIASARETKLERGRVVRLDSTVTAALVHEPSDSSLLWDAVRVMVRLLREADGLVGRARLWWREVPLRHDALELLTAIAVVPLAVCGTLFVLRYAGVRRRAVDLLLWLQCLVLPAALVLLAPDRLFEGAAACYALLAAELLTAFALYFVRTHRAKGLSETAVVYSRVFRNALIPIISLAGLRLGWLVGYSLIVETIFQWPGIGYLLVDAVIRRDYPVAQFFSLLLVAVVVAANLLADVAYGLADPRIRHA